MKKITERNRNKLSLVYSVLGIVLLFPGGLRAEPQSTSVEKPLDVVASLEATIRLLVDPFLPHIDQDGGLGFIPKIAQQPVVEQEKPVLDPVASEIVPLQSVLPLEDPAIFMEPVLEPTSVPEKMVPAIVVSGIIYNTTVPMAIINGEVVRKGGTLNFPKEGKVLTLKEVSKGEVTVEYDGAALTFGLKGSEQRNAE